MTRSELSPELVSRLEADGVDLDRMLRFLDDLNSGKYDTTAAFHAVSVPDISHPSIVDRAGDATGATSYSLPLSRAKERFAALDLPFDCESAGKLSDGTVTFDQISLERIGVHLYPKAAYGVLNGGSASSYADVKKNRSVDPALFDSSRPLFDRLAELCRGQPKGITPAYLNPDGSVGESFLLLKLRMILNHKKKYLDMTGKLPNCILPAFQMTSVHTDAPVMEAFRSYCVSPELKEFSDSLGCPSIELFTETQTMMAAITHSSLGKPRRIFDTAWGEQDRGIAMPGGHGQNFEILAPIYRKMYASGIRYVWLGNIDNMGYTVDPVGLAIFALSGKEAAFEESFRTPMDIKGGILVSDASGKLTCVDIGPAISPQDVLNFEKNGKRVLFNCGVGLFDLEKLVKRLPEIPYKLPLRVSDQDKDAGKYAQAEQITWEIISLLDDPLFFAVDKSRRFVAAKMLMETILTSLPPKTGEMAAVSATLNKGLTRLLESEYALRFNGSRWVRGH